MLTLNQPIRLQSAVGMLSIRDDFGERIRENYGLLSVQFTPKELLLLLSAPQEEPEEQPAMTTLVTQNSLSLFQGVSLSVVNHIVNRILLTQQTPFTYQDTVYISSMLRKAGVVDVSLFMRQVRQLIAQSAAVQNLTALYQTYQGRLSAADRRAETPMEPAQQAAAGGEENLRERYFLHSDIYRRLQTSSVYREICALLTSTASYHGSVESREMKLAEHFRAGSQLRLAELRQRTVDHDRPMTLQHIRNHYERGDLLTAPENEQQVFSRLSEAVLFNTVAKSLEIAVHRGATVGIQNLDLRQALQQSIDDTVFRFENWYTAAPSQGSIVLQGDDIRTTLLTQEQTLLEQLLQRSEQKANIQVQQGDTMLQQTKQAMLLSLRHSEQIVERMQLPAEVLHETLRQVLRTVRADMLPYHTVERAAAQLANRISVLTGGHAAAAIPQERQHALEAMTLQHDLTAHDTVLLRERFDRLDAATREELERRYQQRVQEVQKREGTVTQTEMQRILTEILQQEETTVHERQEREQTIASSERDTLARNAREILERMHRMRTVYQSDHSTASDTAEQLVHTEQTEQDTERFRQQTSRIQTQTLREQLDRIDQHNREMLERIQRARIQEVRHSRQQVRQGDAKRMMSDALRALEHPEEVLGEVLAQPMPDRPKLQLSPDARTLLGQADEPTRRLLEAVMQYEADPAAGLPAQMRTASLAALNAAVAQTEAEPEAAMAAPPHQNAATEELVQQTAQTVLRHVVPSQTMRHAAEAGMQPPQPIEFVHKTEQRTAEREELLEQIEQQRKTVRETQQQQVIEQHEQLQTQQIEQTQQRTIERMSEDVTELINRTLARQLGTISDKVYTQMEKRLRMERARRGR